MLVLPLGILVGSYAGFGNFDNNSGCFTLLLVILYWWSVHLLFTLGSCVLSLILAPPWSGHSNYIGYCQGHTVHNLILAPQMFWCDVTYLTHVILLFSFLVFWLWICLIYLMSWFRTQGDWRSICGVKSLIIFIKDCWSIGNVEFQVNSILMSDWPPYNGACWAFQGSSSNIVFHICRWKNCLLILIGYTCKWNATVNSFVSTHDPSRLMDFYQIFDQVLGGVNVNQNSDPEEVPVGSPISIILDQHKWAVKFRQESIWSRFLRYLLASMGNTHAANIFLLELLHCYQSIANHNSLLSTDLGASVCIMPHW
jgi:hypothetical protein